MLMQQTRDQSRRIAFTCMTRARADPADFMPSRDTQAFAAHCNERFTFEYSEVVSHLTGARAKETGKCQIGQCDHRRRIGARQTHDSAVMHFRFDALGTGHPQAGERVAVDEPRHNGGRSAHEIDQFSRFKHRYKRKHRVRAVIRCCREGRDVGPVPARSARRNRQPGMFCAQRVPGQVIEQARQSFRKRQCPR